MLLTIAKPLAQTIVDKEHAKGHQCKDNIQQNEHVDIEANGTVKIKLISDNFIGKARYFFCMNDNFRFVGLELVLLKVPSSILYPWRILDAAGNVLDAVE
jgi:hypothetical protein